MDLLPKVTSDFSSKEYWESFFKKSTSFEWYGNYFELCGILQRYIKLNDNILIPGCGNSKLSEQLYDSGYTYIKNIDISEVVIKQMQNQNAHRELMTYQTMDLKSMDFKDELFSVIVDKGTLDAIMVDNSDACNETVNCIFKEYYRVLKTGGRYICITLAQDHIIKKLVKYFSVNDCVIRVHKVWIDSDNHRQIKIDMPVFAFVITKFKKLPQLIMEMCLEDNAAPKRINSEQEIIEAVKSQQYYALLRGKLNQNIDQSNDHVLIELFSSEDIGTPRYKLFVVDRIHYNHKLHFGIFIVPQGRECDWLFSSFDGRVKLAESANFRRLIIVILSDSHKYFDMQQIQTELSSKVLELSPPKMPDNYKVPFLSEGTNDIGHRIVRFRGDSKTTGPFVIEDYIQNDGNWYRHLVFTRQQRIVQCEIRLKSINTIKDISKKGDNELQLVPDHSYVASEYTQGIIAGLTVNFEPQQKFKLLVLGLGGGSLSTFVWKNFPNAEICSVEIDPFIVDIGTKWFGVPKSEESPRFQTIIEDGLDFVSNHIIDNKKKFDVVVIDIDSKDSATGICCPPEAFVTEIFLNSVKEILTNTGLLFINLLCRNVALKESITNCITSCFPIVCKFTNSDEYFNEVLICYTVKPSFKKQPQTKKHNKSKKKKSGNNHSNSQKTIHEQLPINYDIIYNNWVKKLNMWDNWRKNSPDKKINVDLNGVLKNISLIHISD